MTTNKIDPHGGVTRYLQLYAALSQELTDGTIDPGAAIPSEPSLVRKFRVSRTTVRRALALLEIEGKIVRRRGSGTFAVGSPGGARRPGERVSQRQEHSSPTSTAVQSRQLDAQSIETPALVQKSMPGFGSAALMVRTLKVLHSRPFALATSYFPERHPAAAAPRAKLPARARGRGKSASLSRPASAARVARAVARAANEVASGEQIVTALAADAFSARQLGLPAGVPVLQVRRLLYDAQERTLEYQDIRYRADLFELRLLLVADGRGGLTDSPQQRLNIATR